MFCHPGKRKEGLFLIPFSFVLRKFSAYFPFVSLLPRFNRVIMQGHYVICTQNKVLGIQIARVNYLLQRGNQWIAGERICFLFSCKKKLKRLAMHCQTNVKIFLRVQSQFAYLDKFSCDLSRYYVREYNKLGCETLQSENELGKGLQVNQERTRLRALTH